MSIKVKIKNGIIVHIIVGLLSLLQLTNIITNPNSLASAASQSPSSSSRSSRTWMVIPRHGELSVESLGVGNGYNAITNEIRPVVVIHNNSFIEEEADEDDDDIVAVESIDHRDIHGDVYKGKVREIGEAKYKRQNTVRKMSMDCNRSNITIHVETTVFSFNGVIYPLGLARNTSCMSEYIKETGQLVYTLPLHGCNTMNIEVGNGVEFFNTIVVQPHRKLVTNSGRSYHIRCTYGKEDSPNSVAVVDQNKKKEYVLPYEVARVNEIFYSKSTGTYYSPLPAYDTMPQVNMHLYAGHDPTIGELASEVRIGDPLTLVITLHNQITNTRRIYDPLAEESESGDENDDVGVYGLFVTDCKVSDGLGWTQQELLDSDGCPLNGEIMSELSYSDSKTTALVHFKAHKFPYTPSVYYQCNIRLCLQYASPILPNNDCDKIVPPQCNKNKDNPYSSLLQHETTANGYTDYEEEDYYDDFNNFLDDYDYFSSPQNVYYSPYETESGRQQMRTRQPKQQRSRQKRQISNNDDFLFDDGTTGQSDDGGDVRVKVYSGLYVREASDSDELDRATRFDDGADPRGLSMRRVHDPSVICFDQSEFAIGIAIAGLLLIVLALIAICCLAAKRSRRHKKDMMSYTSGSSSLYTSSDSGAGVGGMGYSSHNNGYHSSSLSR